MAEKELKVLKLDEMTNLMWIIFIPLIVIILIFSIIEYGFFWAWWYSMMWVSFAVVFAVPVICIISGIIIMILSKLNFVKTDGNWGTLDLMKSVYSELYPEYFKDEK